MCRAFPCNTDPYGIVTMKQGNSLDMVLANVFDDTSEATLSLCGRVAKSAATWKTSPTILLLSNLGFRAGKIPTLYVNAHTHVDVDPCMADAEWLRAFAQRLTTREAVNMPFPKGGKSGSSPHPYTPADDKTCSIRRCFRSKCR